MLEPVELVVVVSSRVSYIKSFSVCQYPYCQIVTFFFCQGPIPFPFLYFFLTLLFRSLFSVFFFSSLFIYFSFFFLGKKKFG